MSLEFVIQAIAGLIDCSGLGKVGVFCTIAFVVLATSKTFHKMIKAFGKAITAYQKATTRPVQWVSIPKMIR